MAVMITLRNTFPSGQGLVDYLSSIYGRFGYEIVFVGAVLEALIVVNFLVPGAVAIGLGAVFARSGELDLTLAILFAVMGAMSGFTVDYFLGRWGFGKIIDSLGIRSSFKKAEHQIINSSVKTFTLGFIHPNLGSFIAFASGVLRLRFLTFFTLSLLSTVVWYSLWGLAVYALGEVFITILTKYVSVIFLIAISVWMLSIIYGRSKKG